jgi:hypothetical protein
LSTPAPRVPLWLAPLIFALTLVPGFALVLLLLLLLAGLINGLLTNGQIQLQLMVLILLVGIVWFIYIHIPHFVRDLFSSLWRRRKKNRRPH